MLADQGKGTGWTAPGACPALQAASVRELPSTLHEGDGSFRAYLGANAAIMATVAGIEKLGAPVP